MKNFIKSLKKIINSGQTRSIVLTGNVYDLFFDGANYVPLMAFLSAHCQAKPTADKKGIVQALFELNHAVEMVGPFAEFKTHWELCNDKKSLDQRLQESKTNVTFALELLRQMAECNRFGKGTKTNLLMIIEAADMLLPDDEISRMSIADRKRVAIVQDWFSDPAFMSGGDTVILVAESRSALHSRIARLPQMLPIDIPLPGEDERQHFIDWFRTKRTEVDKLFSGDITSSKIAEQTTGLSIHAIRQLLMSGDLSLPNINQKVEEYMIGQLGEGVVEFQRPTHTLADLRGFSNLKRFCVDELIPGFQDGSIGGAAFSGPIGGGKTHIALAIAAELGIPVMVLKQIRSMYLGQTDAIIDRLWRLLESFSKLMIFIDEADTQFGGVGEGVHETEKRLTGKIQAMMSDSRLKGKVVWLLGTARIHLLSPDIRRPGRMDLIIPVLDPKGDDFKDFVAWTFDGVRSPNGEIQNDHSICEAVTGYSSAAFAALRNRIKSKKCKTAQEAIEIANDIIQPDIEETRRYQTLQALLNCTRKSLIPADELKDKATWKTELNSLEAKGIR